jgi:hypothetical protein
MGRIKCRTDAAVLELDKIEVTKREEAVAATEADR